MKGTTVTTERRFSRRIPYLAAATAGLVLLAACGSSSDDSAPGTPKSSKDAAASGAQAADSAAIPTQDVVSAIAADPALRAELPAKARDSGKLILGTTRTPGTVGLPHGGEQNGTQIGLDVDLRNAVAKVLGIEWDVQYGTFPTVIPGVQNGRYDVGQDNFGATKEREKVVDFATYLNDGQAFLGSKDTPVDTVKQLTDLCGLTIATAPGSTFQQILTDGAGKCAAIGKKPYKVQYFADNATILLGLQSGKVDVSFGPTLGVKYEAAHLPGTKYLGEVSTTPVGFVTAKDSPVAKALSDAVNKLIATGDYAKIFAKWNLPGSGLTASQLNPAPSF
ncbi:transporter substrate-binding domain-containing protein [Streptomyces cocklensis]|uniref:transporter substrate-binding domain-containing protein n=1 Tax=Actinacidiphila cocklensis TaxID=887465 RepID=UPI00203F711A|nr:transporter substrate-binding domain-containing protein [Actinacidiphila cocklensis]MDD1063368.1 transporter substrate-binding domain-containing protein [Actinacidiphila cocklensis]WSX74872.1 transporter substrate-binding domain-containing protein [Streptomyces sp. NBC_00899]